MPARFLSPDLVELVLGVKLFGFGALVCLLPVTNLDTGSDFALAITISLFSYFLMTNMHLCKDFT